MSVRKIGDGKWLCLGYAIRMPAENPPHPGVPALDACQKTFNSRLVAPNFFHDEPFGENVERILRARRFFIPRRCRNRSRLFVVFTQGGGRASARVCESVWSTVMAKFLFIYRESTESRGSTQPSPAEMQALQAAWY